MTGEEKPKKKKRRLIGIAGSILSLAILTYIAIALITGRQSDLFGLFGLFSGGEPALPASEYRFDVGRRRVFADLNGSIAAAGTLGIQVFDAGGGETLRDPFRMSSPAVSAMEERAISFDVGGTAVRVFDKTNIIASVEINGAIVSASINRNGWFAVCAQEGAALKGVVNVYNSAGKDVYRVNMASGYVLSAELSPDNKSLAILNLTGDGSRITYYDLNSENVRRVFDLPGRLIVDIRYLTGDDVLAVATDSLLIVNKNTISRELYAFDGRRLGSFDVDNGLVALYLLDYGVGRRGRLVSIGGDGKLLGELETDKELVSMSLRDGRIAVLRGDGPSLYNIALKELPALEGSAPATGATRVLALDGGRALAAGDHSAVVYSIHNS